jgi:putative ABC transport system permease protein
MIRNYFKTAWRNIWNNKFYSAVNVIGLTVGLTVGLLILLWVNDELSLNKFNTKADNIYQMQAQIGKGSGAQVWNNVQAPIAFYALKDVPGVVNAVRLVHADNYSVFKYKDKQFTPGDHGSYYADPSLFKIFDFKLLKGDVNNPFPNTKSVLLSQATAKRFFGDEDPMGKVFQADNTDSYTVAGIVADPPGNSSIKFDMLFSMDLKASEYDSKGYWKAMNADWGNYYADTYLQLQPGISLATVLNKLTQIHIQYQPGADAANVKYLAQQISQLRLYSSSGKPTGMQTVRVFLIVAILILLIACINYVNLSTARAMLRSKEVSVRKIIGADRKQLFAQFIIETVLFFSIALIVSFGLITLLMPLYNDLSGKQMEFNLFDASIWKVIGITVVATLTASSIYPAFLLSSFKPINALKGKMTMGVGNTTFRKALVVCQFIFSIGLIIGTLIINGQLKYIHEKDLGYDKSYVFNFAMRGMQKDYEAIKAQLLSNIAIKGVTTAGQSIVAIDNSTSDTEWDGKETGRTFVIHPVGVAANYVDFFKLKMAEGVNFAGIKSDTAHYILNETAVREAGITNPIGKRFKLHEQNGTIIGVVKDFHFSSLRDKIEPAIFYYTPQNWQMYVRTTGKDAPQAIAAVQTIWKKYNAGFPFTYTFVDDTYDQLYKSDERSGTLFSYFAGIAILISCLGLFGLATYTAQVKVKEIGIRKVLGASVTNITAMLSKDFLTLVLLSIVIATPIAWYAMSKWLQGFAYQMQIQWWVFAIAGFAGLFIAFITISFQSIKAALANPVKSLRSE